MKKVQTENEGVENAEPKAELKPFFFAKEGETIMATSQEEAQKILAERIEKAEQAKQ